MDLPAALRSFLLSDEADYPGSWTYLVEALLQGALQTCSIELVMQLALRLQDALGACSRVGATFPTLFPLPSQVRPNHVPTF